MYPGDEFDPTMGFSRFCVLPPKRYQIPTATITSSAKIFIPGSGQRVRSPGYQKLCARVIHIRDNRKGQPNRGAMEEPRLGGTALMITVAPTPGKYALAAGASTTSTSTQSAAALKYTANVGKSVFLPKIT
uniref:Uncharacterized protein n=1 Tax=Lutzomyia longipalpis TaxID=7200 RepID=A0A1B0CJR1_LUTLO